VCAPRHLKLGAHPHAVLADRQAAQRFLATTGGDVGDLLLAHLRLG